MADYLATNTPRLRMTYTGARGTHKMTFRLADGIGGAAGLTAVTPIIELMFPFMINNVSWVGAEFAPEGSDIFIPIEFTPIVSGVAIENVSNNNPYGEYINFVGRSAGGSRVAFYLFNCRHGLTTANNRLSPAEEGAITALVAAFTANSATLRGIDQTPFVMRAYANTGINKLVARKSRALA